MAIKNRLFIILFVFIGFLCTVPARAELEPQAMEFLNHYRIPLRWDNIEGVPAWVGGAEPRYSSRHHCHLVTLRPGDDVMIRVPAHGMVRIFNPLHIPDQTSLAAFVSRGNSLFLQHSFSIIEGSHSLLVHPNLQKNGLFRLTLSSSARDPVQVALFVSRYETPRELLPYRHLLELAAPAVNVQTKPYGANRSFQQLSAGRPTQIRVKGPLRVLLEHRLVFPPEGRTGRTPYIIRGLLDTDKFLTLSNSSQPESKVLLQVDELYPTLGTLKKSYFTLPKGEHILTLIPELDLLVRLTARDEPDYLFPGLNNPFSFDNEQARENRGKPSTMLQPELTDPVDMARSLWQNNRYPEGGLSAAMAWRRLAKRYPGSTDLQRESRQIELAYTFYRDLFPKSQGRPLQQAFTGFISPHLKQGDVQQKVIRESNLPAVADTIERAYFTSLPAIHADDHPSETPSLTFLLPRRQTPSKLRILVDVTKKQPGSFTVTIDDTPEIRCDVLPQLARPEDEFELNLAEAAMNLPYDIRSHFFPLSPKLDSRGRSTAVQYVAEVIIPLDSAAKKIILRPVKTSDFPIRVAMQYRDSSPFTLTEPKYLLAEKNLAQKITPYQVALKMLANPQIELNKEDEKYGEGIHQLEPFLRPLIRYIHTRNILFSSSAYPIPDESDTAVLPTVAIDIIRERISRARNANQWISVLENSMVLYHGTQGQSRINAAILVVDALEQSGEHYLAEMRLRGMLLYPQGSEGSRLAELAQLRLERLYRNRNDMQNLSSLYAANLCRNPSPLLLKKLADILLLEGRSRLALSASVILPATGKEPEVLLRAALKAGWHRIFNSTVATIRDPEEQNYWRGILQEKLGGTDNSSLFTAAGSRGNDHLRILEQARAIETELIHGDLEKRQQAIFYWEQWQGQLPAPYTWKSEPWLVSGHGGGMSLYSEAQDLKMLMFRAAGNRPVQARIWGPVTMKFVLRPLHAKSSSESLTGWAFLRIDDELELIPVNNNRPVQQWIMPPGAETVPGRAVVYERYLDPGPHEITVSSETLSLLVGLQVQRPEYNYGLPPLNHTAVETLLQGAERKEDPRQVSRWRGLVEDSLAVLSPNPEKEPIYFSSGSLKFNRDLKPGYFENSPMEFIARLETARKHQPGPTVDEENESREITQLMGSGKWEDALSATPETTAAERFRRMSLLTYLTETMPGRQAKYEALARRLLQNHVQEKDLYPLLQRISGQGQWQRVDQVQGSAGLRLISLQNWHPESPSLRIRKTLLTTALDRDAVLTSRDPLVLSLDNMSTAELEVSWRLSEVSYLRPENMEIVYQLDDHQQKTITLGPEQPEQSIRIRIPPGRHRLLTAVKSRYSNQFLQVRFQEISPSSGSDTQGVIWSPPLKERTYHVVTREEPLYVPIRGPAWIRIDELYQADTFSRYIYIKPGLQTIEVLPDINHKETLVRLFQRVAKNSSESEGLSRTTIRTYPGLPPPLLALSDENKPDTAVRFVDDSRMVHQKDGTWSTTFSWHKRRDLEEDTVSQGSESFFQLSETYHRFYEPVPAYLKSSLFVRKRTSGGPTLGLKGDITRRFSRFPLTLRLEGEGLTQNPEAEDTAIFDRSQTEWSVRFKASAYQYRYFTPKFKHRPTFSLFGRLLSLDNASGYVAGTIDQDIFTVYKSDHPSGIQFSEYLNYRPWLDTALFARGSFSTNADMNPCNPDNMRLAAGFGQLIGPAKLDFRYQITYFFEDEDRTEKIDRNDLSFGLSWDHWFQDQSRLQLGMKWQYRLDTGEFSGMAGLTWFFSTGRAMRDLRPEDDMFYTIKSNRASQLMNNEKGDA